jgi:hypothetical protein
MRPHISSDEAHRIAFGFSPPDDRYFATRLRDGLGERGRRPRRSVLAEIGHSENQNRPLPELPNMLAMGMGITEALAFWNEMMNSPQMPASYWWDQIRVRTSTLGGPSLH